MHDPPVRLLPVYLILYATLTVRPRSARSQKLETLTTISYRAYYNCTRRLLCFYGFPPLRASSGETYFFFAINFSSLRPCRAASDTSLIYFNLNTISCEFVADRYDRMKQKTVFDVRFDWFFCYWSKSIFFPYNVMIT